MFRKTPPSKTYISQTSVPRPNKTYALMRELEEMDKRGEIPPLSEDDFLVYELCSYFGENTIEMYTAAAAFTKDYGFTSVIDLGCASGFPEELFESIGIGYLGISPESPSNRGGCKHHLAGRYPNDINRAALPSNALLISRLCVGYFISSPEDLAQLAHDFSCMLLSAPESTTNLLRRYYTTVMPVLGNDGEYWMYFERKGE